MKTLHSFFTFALAMLVSLSFVACGGDDDPTSDVPPTPTEVKVESVTINVSSLTLVEGDSQTITVTISPTNATNKKYTFSSLNPEVASVDENGKITALKAGETNIIVTSVDGKKTASCTVKVEAKFIAVTSITLDKTSITLTEGEKIKINASVSPEDATNPTLTWEVSDSNIVSVDSEGNVEALKAGEATINVTSADGKKTATCNVIVEAKYIAVTSITLDNTSVTLKVGEKIKINASLTPEDATDPTLIWEVSNTDIVSVDNEGNVEALKLGEAEIIVYAENKSVQATCKISVIPEAVTGISLSDEKIKLMPGDTHQLSSTITPENADDKSVTWSIKDSSIASVDQNGLVTAKKIGETTVTVTTKDGGFTATCTINVVDITGMVTAKISTSSTVSINGYIQPGSSIGTYLSNESRYNIIPKSLQLIDGLSGVGGNIMGIGEEILAPGSGVGYSITIKKAIYQPIIRWTYTYDDKEYTTDCQYSR